MPRRNEEENKLPIQVDSLDKLREVALAETKVRQTSSSIAGAGSGEFHTYRLLRRKEMFRQKMMDEIEEKNQMEKEFEEMKEARKAEIEEKQESKKQKRRKKKEKQKVKREHEKLKKKIEKNLKRKLGDDETEATSNANDIVNDDDTEQISMENNHNNGNDTKIDDDKNVESCKKKTKNE